MSSRDKKIILVLMIFCTFFSCKNNESEISYKKYEMYKKYSTDLIGESSYNEIGKSIKDSITNWGRNKLQNWEYDILDSTIKIDSLMCFNSNKDKFVSSILAKSYYTQEELIKNNTKDWEMDGLHFFLGVKIKERWYFFTGATIYLPRKNYQSDTHVPLSFDKLHQIAMKEVFSGYLIKDAKGNWQINDKFFDELKIGEGGYWFSRCKTQEDVEKRVMEIVNNNWQKK